MTQTQNGQQRIVDAVSGEVLQPGTQQLVRYDLTPKPAVRSTLDIISEETMARGADMTKLASKMDQLTTYTGVEPTDIVKWANKPFEVIGAVIETVEDYESRKEPGMIKPGFHYALWKINQKDAEGNNIVFKISSSQGIKLTTSLMLPIAGYCDWHDVEGNVASLKVVMTIGSGNRHLFRILEK